jgi:hypothetical protein
LEGLLSTDSEELMASFLGVIPEKEEYTAEMVSVA